MSVEKAQERIKAIQKAMKSIEGLTGIHTVQIIITGETEYRQHETGTVFLDGDLMRKHQELLKKQHDRLSTELSTLQGLMHAADLIFQNSGGGNEN